jgi:hypothetical protein
MHARMCVCACLCFVQTNENKTKKNKYGGKNHFIHTKQIFRTKFNLHFIHILHVNPIAILALYK